MFKFHYPARGRKRLTQRLNHILLPVQIPLPRKGTETLQPLLQRCKKTRFKFHYPARGRKPEPPFASTPKLHVQVQIPLPRKGTETRGKGLFLYPHCIVQIPLPRKGTETLIAAPPVELFPVVQIPLPRKGTETCC